MPEPIELWPGGFRGLNGRRILVRADEPLEALPSADGVPDPALRDRTVYVHGLEGSSINWTDLMGALCDGFAGEALDLPGFGASPPPPDGDYSVDAQAAVVTELLRSGDHPTHLVGNSMGAAVAVRVAAETPALVRSLTLISPALPDLWPRLVPYQMTGALIPVIGPAIFERIRSRPPEVRVQGTLDATFHDPGRMPAQRVMEALEAERERDQHPHASAAALGALRGIVAEYLRPGARSLWRQAAGVWCPTLLVYAGDDKFVHPRMARKAARTFPRNRLVLLPRTGHLPMMECPERVAMELRSFLTHAQTPERGTVSGPD